VQPTRAKWPTDVWKIEASAKRNNLQEIYFMLDGKTL
jgi:hypothetical protein